MHCNQTWEERRGIELVWKRSSLISVRDVLEQVGDETKAFARAVIAYLPVKQDQVK